MIQLQIIPPLLEQPTSEPYSQNQSHENILKTVLKRFKPKSV